MHMVSWQRGMRSGSRNGYQVHDTRSMYHGSTAFNGYQVDVPLCTAFKSGSVPPITAPRVFHPPESATAISLEVESRHEHLRPHVQAGRRQTRQHTHTHNHQRRRRDARTWVYALKACVFLKYQSLNTRRHVKHNLT